MPCVVHEADNTAIICSTTELMIDSGDTSMDVMLPDFKLNADSERPESIKVTPAENLLTFVAFIVMGSAAMSYWNTLIQCLYSIQKIVHPANPDISDTITASYTTFSLIGTSILIFLQAVNANLLYAGATGFVVATLGSGMVCFIFDATGVAVALHLLAALGGCSTALFESSMFSFASILPHNYVGAVSLGLGISGVISFAGWMLLSKAIFPMTSAGVKYAVWAYLSSATAVQILAVALFACVYHKPWAQRSAAIALAQRKEKEMSSMKKKEMIDRKVSISNALRNPRTKWDVFKDACEQIMNVSGTLWLTLMMFPNIAPYAWGRSVIETDILLGIWQCGDLSGRYLPVLKKWIPYVAVKPENVKYFALSRLVFLPLFVTIYRLPDEQLGFLSSFWFQAIAMFVFVFSSGWICTLSSMYVPECVEDADEKGQAATMYVLCLLLGITVGIWMSKLWKL